MSKDFLDVLYRVTPQRELRLDLRMPEGLERPPLILYIPMGGMRSCRKERAPEWPVERGFAVASIQARVAEEAIAPAAVEDCKFAVRWLRAHAEEYGYDGDRIGAWGHSAGGLLAALLGTSGDRPELRFEMEFAEVSDRVHAVVDACGAPHDIAYFARPEVREKFGPVAGNLDAYLGGPVGEQLELAKLVSPRTYVSAECPPVLLLHGDRDEVVPLEESVEFAEALRDCGVDVTLKVLEGVGHVWPSKTTASEVEGFFRRVLGN